MHIKKQGYHDENIGSWKYFLRRTPNSSIWNVYSQIKQSWPPDLQVSHLKLVVFDTNSNKNQDLIFLRAGSVVNKPGGQQFVEFSNFKELHQFLERIQVINPIKKMEFFCDLIIGENFLPAVVFISIGLRKFQINLYCDNFFFHDIAVDHYINFNSIIHAVYNCGCIEKYDIFDAYYSEVYFLAEYGPRGLEIPLQVFPVTYSNSLNPNVDMNELSSIKKLGIDIGIELHQANLMRLVPNAFQFQILNGHINAINLNHSITPLHRFPLEDFPFLRYLNLAHVRDFQLEKQVWPDLLELHVIDSPIVSLPDNFCSLYNLHYCFLRNNQIESLPTSINKLEGLLFLDLEGNQLTNLPPSLGSLKSLVMADLSRNKIETLPKTLERLVSLRALDVASNRLTELPETIHKLSSLRGLNISNNKITHLPQDLRNTSLELLLTEGNPLDMESQLLVEAINKRQSLRLVG